MDIVNALMSDIKSTPIKYSTQITDITKNGDIFNVITDNGEFVAKSVIIANGGVSYPHLGVSNIGHVIAKKFGHKIEPIRPALCALKTHYFTPELSGIALPVEITVNKHKIAGDLLFTHFGIGWPVVYRATLINAKEMTINFAPNIDVFELLKTAKTKNGKRQLQIYCLKLFQINWRILCMMTNTISQICATTN